MSRSDAGSDARDRRDAADSDDDDDMDTREEARDRRNVEEYFDWDKGWPRHFKRRHSRGDELVNFGRDSHLPAGAHADSVVSIFGSASSEGDAGDMVAILGDTNTSGHVKDSAVAVLGNVRIDGPVGGDVVAVFGNVDLGPHADVGGDVTAVGGAVTRDPAAAVRGEVQSIGGFASGFERFRPWIDHCLFYGRPLALVPDIGWAWGLALFFLALYVCLALLFRDAVTRCVSTVETQPGMTLVAALLSILLVPIVIVLLCITVIGIAAIPFVFFGLFCMGLFGKAVDAGVARRAGERRASDCITRRSRCSWAGSSCSCSISFPCSAFFSITSSVSSDSERWFTRSFSPDGPGEMRNPRGAAYAAPTAAAGAVPPAGAPAGPAPGAARRGGQRGDARRRGWRRRPAAARRHRSCRRRDTAARGILDSHGGAAPRCAAGRISDWHAASLLRFRAARTRGLWGVDVEAARLDRGWHRFSLASGQSRWPADRLGNGHRAGARLLPVTGGRRPRLLLDRLRLG